MKRLVSTWTLRSKLSVAGVVLAATGAMGFAGPKNPVPPPSLAGPVVPAADATSLTAVAAPEPAPVESPSVDVNRLAAVAPGLDREVLGLALTARAAALREGRVERPDVLTVIDYSRPSTEERMWVLDVEREKLLYRELVSHGKNSGANLTTSFSNVDGSNQTSLGVFATADTYYGRNGYSLRLQGLEPGVNDNAMARAIVIHGAPYVSKTIAQGQGRLGRSLGCPAVSTEVSRELIDTIKGGSAVFAYYPERGWLSSSPYVSGAVAAG